jgi:hypothetical protein
MSKGTQGAKATDRNPARQTDENEGTIKRAQVTDATMRRKDMARGSEPAAGYNNGRGPK